MPFQAARQYCQQHDYDLASIHSAQEQQFAADQCAKFSQPQRAAASSECQHQLASGDVNMASNQWISNSEEWEYVGCFIGDVDGTGHTDPWPDAASLGTARYTDPSTGQPSRGDCDPLRQDCLAYGQDYPGIRLANWERCRQAARAAGFNT